MKTVLIAGCSSPFAAKTRTAAGDLLGQAKLFSRKLASTGSS